MGLDQVELVMEVEGEFGIHIPDEEAQHIFTVGQLTDYVLAKQLDVIRHASPPAPTPLIDRTAIDARVRRIVSEQLGVPLERVTPESRFVEDLGAG